MFGHAAGRLLAQHAPDGVRGVVRPARDGAEPVPDRPARWRPHLLRRARPRGRPRCRSSRQSRPSVLTFCLVELDGVDRPDARDAVLMFGPRHPRVTRRGRAARYRAASGSRCSRVVMFVLCFTPAPIDPIIDRTACNRSSANPPSTARSADRRRRSCGAAISGRPSSAARSASRIVAAIACP